LASAKERFKNVAEGAKSAKVLPTAGVVVGSRLGIGENLIGVGDELELVLGAGFFIDIGVQLAGEFAVCLFDVLRRGVAIEA
jgi:hypothetical protein